MCGENLWDRLVELAEKDVRYQEVLDKVKRLEPAFLAIRESLCPEQRQLLDDYIAACEAMDQCETYLAAELSSCEACLCGDTAENGVGSNR